MLKWLVFSWDFHIPTMMQTLDTTARYILLSLSSIQAIKTLLCRKTLAKISTSSLMRVNWCQRVSSVHRNISFKGINISFQSFPPHKTHLHFFLAILNSSHTEYHFYYNITSFSFCSAPSSFIIIIAINISTGITQKKITKRNEEWLKRTVKNAFVLILDLPSGVSTCY